MKKTTTLVLDIDGMGKDALTARPGAAPGIQSEAPRYSDVRSTLHTLGITVRPPSLADLALRSSHPLPGPLKPSQSLAPAEDIQVIIQVVQLLR